MRLKRFHGNLAAYLRSSLAGAGLLAGQACCFAAPCTLAGLDWMTGSWRNSSNPAGSQERWVAAPGNILMGSAWEVNKNGSGFAEIMTVRQDGASIVMVLRHFDIALSKAWEERTAPMIFAASSCEGQSAIFDGQGDRQGEHLTYKRSGENLLIVGDFLHNGKPDHEEWRMIAAKE